MRVVIDIPDETFYGTNDQLRVARYIRLVAEALTAEEDSPPSAGTVCLNVKMASPDHTAGWAVEGASWQQPVEVEP